MTDQKETPASESTDAADAKDETADTGRSTDPDKATAHFEEVSSSPSRHGIAWLGVLLALASLAGVGWVAWQQMAQRSSAVTDARIEQMAAELQSQSDTLQAQSDRGDERNEQLDGFVRDLAQLRSRLESLAGQDRTSDTALDPLRDSIENQARATDSLSNDLDALRARLEQQMAALHSRRDTRIGDALDRAEYRLALLEIAGLLRVARTGARIGDDPALLIEAYEQAVDRAGALGDSRVDGLRQTLAGELESLRGMEPTDWSALVGRLAALETESANWPLAGQGDAGSASAESADAAASDAEDDGWWSEVGRSLRGLVRVTPRASAPLSPAAAESVRERIRLHLTAAQAAATRREPEAMRPHLSASLGLLESHFDPEDRGVRQALVSIEEAAAIRVAEWPELGSSLAEVERLLGGS